MSAPVTTEPCLGTGRKPRRMESALGGLGACPHCGGIYSVRRMGGMTTHRVRSEINYPPRRP